MSRARGGRLAAAAAAALALAAPAALAHLVPAGIGSQTELRLAPRRIRVNYNLGFSVVLGLGELRRMDTDKDGVVVPREQEAYLELLGREVLPKLSLTVDGEPLALQVRARRGLGILGPIDQVQFDTWFELEAPCALGPGPHRLTFYEGTYEGQQAEQLLWVPLDQAADLARLEATQERPVAPAVDLQGNRRFVGRDLAVEFEFTPDALERDRALERIEPWLEGLERTGDALADGVARAVEEEAAPLAFREPRWPRPRRAVMVGGGAGAAMAQDRVLDADTGRAVGSGPPPDSGGPSVGPGRTAGGLDPRGRGADDSATMIKELRQPFSLLALLAFFVWGAGHALLPGHGKTMVGAYLLGTQGRVRDALRLGAIVTFTHVFALYTAGLAIVWVAERYGSAQGQAFQEKLTRHVTLLSGLGLMVYGLSLAWWRAQALGKPAHSHAHGDHAHAHAPSDEAGQGQGPHEHEPTHADGTEHVHAQPTHADGTEHAHPHAPGEHEHGGRPQSHGHAHSHGHDHAGTSEAEHARAHADGAANITGWRDLLVLGVTGGLVPCPAGVTLVFYSMTLPGENTRKAFVYLTSFSLGLGSVLVAIALTMVVTRSYLTSQLAGKGPPPLWLQRLPIATAGLIALIGGAMCWEAFDPGYARLSTMFGG